LQKSGGQTGVTNEPSIRFLTASDRSRIIPSYALGVWSGMRATSEISNRRVEPLGSERAVWIALIITVGTVLSTVFACATPFAALAALAAMKLGWRPASVVIGLVWLANQTIGYGMLGYPWTWDSAAWGVAIGMSAGLATLAAMALSATYPVRFAVGLPFLAAFVAFEIGLFLAGFVLPGSNAAFSVPVIGHVFLINVVALAGLLAVDRVATMSRIYIRKGLVRSA